MSLPPYLKPGDKVVLYDQHCRFCTLWSGFLARRADHRLKLLAAQSAEGLAILDWFGLAPDHFDTWLFVDGAYACDDNDALLEVLRLLPGPWRHLLRESEINQKGKARKLWDIEEGKGI
ncbi:DCC1-like thiol-disulfide oxidoreductase family protein [Pseudomonas aeruginosa]